MPALSRRSVLMGSVAVALSLSGCANVNGTSNDAPHPVKVLPAPIASDVRTDLGEYFARPKAGVSSKEVQATMGKLRSMPGVQSADLRKDGRVDLQFLGASTPDQREAAVKQLGALGPIEEGI